MFDEVFVFHRRGRAATTTAALRLVVADRLRLRIAVVRHGHDHVFVGDQVFDRQIELTADDFGEAIVAVRFADVSQLGADHLEQAFGRCKDREQIGDFVENFLIFIDQLALLERSQPVQAQIENRLRLLFRQVVETVAEAELRIETFGTTRIAAGAREQLGDVRRRPALRHQSRTRFGRIGRRADQFDHLVDVRQCNGLAFEDVATLPRTTQQEHRSPRHHFAAVFDERLEHLLQVEHARLPVDERDAVDAVHALQLRLAVEVVQHDFAGFTAAQFDDDAQPVLVGFVAQLGDAFDLLLFDELGDALDQPRLVQLIRNLGDDDRVFTGLFVGLDLGARTHEDAAAAGLVRFDDAGATVDDAAVGKSGPLMNSIKPSIVISGSSINARQPSITSRRLCGGMFVAMPTAIPDEPFTSRFGTRFGNTSGICSVSS